MLSSIRRLEHCRICTTAGVVGTVVDTYLDDHRWVVRYLVADVGSWLHERKVLLLPHAVKSFDWPSRTITTDLSRAQIRACPSVDAHAPVSRQHEHDLRWYEGSEYGYGGWGVVPIVIPGAEVDAETGSRRPQGHSSAADRHLCSSREVIGYHVEAADDAIGHVADFLFEGGTWAIPYAVIGTRNWLPRKLVRISTKRIEGVNWEERTVVIAMSCGAIRESPAYQPAQHCREPSSTNQRTPS